MSQKPTPHDDVPAFIVERFADHSAAELRNIATYAESLETSIDVPQYVVQAFAIQDDETRTVVAIYAAELAAFLEEQAQRKSEDEEDDSSPPGPGRMGGAFFG
ncbi:hypothetical protein EA462_03750 [Natrarchaeobius halalkaliphilus]|uniref:Uncharacterized protein n=1 Tax=Natrarchaeobius halalkaliphilus TaxID=1679091 RepID=A0A3N6M533_9EURY|nr:hypothetical protein [Natrarchaeobius halalkaliphilus]RQG91120.1 hypothetical protein EA462_03750 [Natrarchaeobius halalkaliphilus]